MNAKDRPAHHAPLPHPRRDPLLRRARLGAASVCAVANGVMFWLGLRGVLHGAEMNLSTMVAFIAALLVVGTRVPIIVELWLGGLDRGEGLEHAPSFEEVARRAAVGVVIPWGVAVLALARLGDVGTAFWCLLALVVLEGVWRFGGFATWRGPRIDTEILRATVNGDAQAAALAFAQAPMHSSREFEASALIVSSLAIRKEGTGALDVIVGVVRRRAESDAGDALVRRTLLVVEADRARFDDPISAAEHEARALRDMRPGHPRRLSLALFVATTALETEQPRAAVDALSMLHARDAMSSAARLVVNWLLAEAARHAGNEELVARCWEALLTFDVSREAASIGEEGISGDAGRNDPYAKWMMKAKESMLARKDMPAPERS